MEREITDSRKAAMELIAHMNEVLQKYIPGQVGRYDDSFNENCFGDAIQMLEVPVVLFEAGHIGRDYMRETTRSYIFYSLIALFGFEKNKNTSISYKKYFQIPENKKIFYDYILRNVKINGEDNSTSIAIQFTESLENDSIKFVPKIIRIDDLKGLLGHVEMDAKFSKILVNSQNNINIDLIVSVIINKNDNSLIYFDKNNFLF